MSRNKKRKIAVSGTWLPMSLGFLRSRACAELSPHGAKLLLDILSQLGPNAIRNGDISLSPNIMSLRGWTSRSTLHAAIKELIEHGLLVQTRQGSRLDCSLYAITLYPLDCDLKKLDVGPGCYTHLDCYGEDGRLKEAPTKESPARWRRSRKVKTLDPPWDNQAIKRPATGQTAPVIFHNSGASSRHGTKTLVLRA